MSAYPRFLFALLPCLLVAVVGSPTQVAAQGQTGNFCVRDFLGGAVCTANDVRIDDLIVVAVNEDCPSGTPGETEVVFKALVSSEGSPDRYDIGLFLALDGGSARDGDFCYHDNLAPPLTPAPTYGDFNSDTVPDINDGPWWDGGTDGDSCGDIQSNTQLFKTLPALRFACVDSSGDGSVDVSVAVSWDNNTNSACSAVSDAFPGTNSKCSLSLGVELGIPPDPAITIVKSPASQEVAPGGSADFSFSVTANTTVANIVVSDPDCDAAPLFTGGDANSDSILNPDETWTYTCSKSGVTASFTNTVTVTGDGPVVLGEVSDTDSAEVVVLTPPPPPPPPPAMPVIGLAKRVTDLANLGGGLWDVSMEFVVENLGDTDLFNVQVTDDLSNTFPAPLTFSIQVGPAATGTLTANAGFNGSGDINLLNAGASSLAVGASATVTVTVRFNLNGAEGPFSNLARASADSAAGATADTSDNGTDPDPDGDGNPDEPGENDPTPIVPITITVLPATSVSKVSNFDPGSHDNDGSGDLTPGDLLAYTIALINNGTGDALDVVVNDTPDVNTSLVVGSVTTSQGAVVTGNTVGDNSIQVDVGTIAAAGGSATVAFEVLIDNPLPPGVTAVQNQGLISGSNFADIPTDDPDTAPDGDPTVNQVWSLVNELAVAIPLFPQWALLVIVSLLIAAAAWIRRRA